MIVTMRALLRRQVNSRSEVESLTVLEQRQLTSAAQFVIGAADLEGALDWSDRERLGWLQVRFDDDDGVPRYDAWLLAHGDDGLLFEHGAETHLGIALSQTYLVDAQPSRKRLVEALQQALDRLQRPLFLGWLEEDVRSAAEEPVETPEKAVELELALRKA